MKFVVTGGLGFIGSHLANRILAEGHQVCVVDSLVTGFEEFARKDLKEYTWVRADIKDFGAMKQICQDFKPDWVVHLAANADVRHGLEWPEKDLLNNTVGTWNILEAARLSGCKNFMFSSTGSVYGEPEVFPTPEMAPFPVQTSLYAASKLAGEAMISAYAHGYGMKAVVFRFVSILGPHYSHGHVFDFIAQLKKHPEYLDVLGDGEQTKSYLHIEDLMAGIWNVIKNPPANNFEVFNIGHEDALTVKLSISYIIEAMKINPELRFTGGLRGWIGDSPRIQLDTRKLQARGWRAERSLKQAVQDTCQFLLEHPSFMEKRN